MYQHISWMTGREWPLGIIEGRRTSAWEGARRRETARYILVVAGPDVTVLVEGSAEGKVRWHVNRAACCAQRSASVNLSIQIPDCFLPFIDAPHITLPESSSSLQQPSFKLPPILLQLARPEARRLSRPL